MSDPRFFPEEDDPQYGVCSQCGVLTTEEYWLLTHSCTEPMRLAALAGVLPVTDVPPGEDPRGYMPEVKWDGTWRDSDKA